MDSYHDQIHDAHLMAQLNHARRVLAQQHEADRLAQAQEKGGFLSSNPLTAMTESSAVPSGATSEGPGSSPVPTASAPAPRGIDHLFKPAVANSSRSFAELLDLGKKEVKELSLNKDSDNQNPFYFTSLSCCYVVFRFY